jgi:hypothetical protein
MRQNQVRSWKLRADGLAWISSLTSRWRYEDGRPDLNALAADTGMSYQNLYRINRDSDWPISSPIAVALADGAAEESGLPFLVAYLRLFREPDEARTDRPWFEGAVTAAEILDAFIRDVSTYTLASALEPRAA